MRFFSIISINEERYVVHGKPSISLSTLVFTMKTKRRPLSLNLVVRRLWLVNLPFDLVSFDEKILCLIVSLCVKFDFRVLNLFIPNFRKESIQDRILRPFKKLNSLGGKKTYIIIINRVPNEIPNCFILRSASRDTDCLWFVRSLFVIHSKDYRDILEF